MPIIWKLLVKRFFKIYFLIIGISIGALLAFNSELLVQASSIGYRIPQLATFFFNITTPFQTVIITLASGLSTFYLFFGLSSSNELLTLRSNGLNLKTIQFPIVVICTCISILNFVMISEITPLASKPIHSQAAKILFCSSFSALKNHKIAGLTEAYIDIDTSNNENTAQDITIIQRNPSLDRLILCKADELTLTPNGFLKGINTTYLYHFGKMTGSNNSLIIENQDTTALDLNQILANNISPAHLSISTKNLPLALLKYTPSQKAFQQIVKRVCLGFFPLLICFGAMFVGQVSHYRLLPIRLLSLLLLFLYTTCTFHLSKKLNTNLVYFYYLSPYLFTFALALFFQNKYERGRE